MAADMTVFKGSMFGHTEPYEIKGLFAAGSSQAVKRGEILTVASGTWTPLASDTSMSAVIGFAAEEIKAGDRAGYYRVIVPRPGDIFELPLATAAAVAFGANLYYSTSQKLTTSGSNQLGSAVGDEHYPALQGHLADDGSPDAGTTIKSTSYVRFTVKASVSYYAALQE